MSETLTAAQVAEIQRRCDAASEGPWRECKGFGIIKGPWMKEWCREPEICRCPLGSPDPQFIAAARTDLPALLRDRAALVAEVKRLRAELAQHNERHNEQQ